MWKKQHKLDVKSMQMWEQVTQTQFQIDPYVRKVMQT